MGDRPYMAGYQSLGCPEENSIWGREGARALTSPAERSALENEPQGTFLSLLSATRMEKERLKNHRDRPVTVGPPLETSEVLWKQASIYRSQAPN